MGLIEADFARFADAEAGFRNVLLAFEGVLSELERDLRVDLAAWEGDAVKAFEAFVAEWHASARELAGELARLHEAIQVVHANLRSAKSASLRMWTL